jgi:hypothetical protein
VALLDRMDYPGKGGAAWSADDEDHAYRVGVVHASARLAFNPPRERQHRAAYLQAYRELTEDESLPNTYPDT